MVRRMWQGVTRCPFPVACSLLAARCLLPGARSFERRRSARFPLPVARGQMPGGPRCEVREARILDLDFGSWKRGMVPRFGSSNVQSSKSNVPSSADRPSHPTPGPRSAVPAVTLPREMSAIPELHRVQQRFDRSRIEDVAGTVDGALADPEVEATLAGLGSVAVAVGSRGIAEVAGVVGTLGAGLRRRGLQGFLGPAVGSNG